MDVGQAHPRLVWRSPWIWAGLLLLLHVLMRWISGCDGLYGQDAYAYYNYATAIQAHWQTGQALSVFNWPTLYPFLGALWPMSNPAILLQALSMLGAAVLLLMSIRIARAHFPNQQGLEAILFLFIGLAPFLLRGSLSIMSDSLGTGMAAWALWHGERYLRHNRGYDLILASLMTGFAVWTRYPVAILMLIPILLWLFHALRQRHWLWILLTVPAGLVAAIPQFWIVPASQGAEIGHAFQNVQLSQWSISHWVQRDFVQADGEFHYTFPNFIASLGMFWYPLYLGLGVLGTLGFYLLRRELKTMHIWPYLAAILIYSLFLAGIPFQNPRFLLPMLPFAAIVLMPGWAAIWNRFLHSSPKTWLLLFLVFMAQFGMSVYGSRKLIAASALERQIVADLNLLPRPSQRLYEFGTEAMLQARGLGYAHESMWNAEIIPAQTGDYVLFNLEAFEKQFDALPPMQHWREFQNGWLIKPLKTWEGGWTLYVLE